jgi:hypothetical protein
MSNAIRIIIAGAFVAVLAENVHAATPAEQCQAAKLKASAKYAACRLLAERRATLRGTAPDFARCDERYTDAWAGAESTFGSDCPSSGDAEALRGAVTALTTNVGSALGGAPLDDCPATLAVCNAQVASCNSSLATCGSSLASCQQDLATAFACGNAAIDSGEDCDQSNLNGASCTTLGYSSGSLACGSGCHFDTSGCVASPKLIFATSAGVFVGDNGPPIGFFTYPSRGDEICNKFANGSDLTRGKTFKALVCGRQPDVADDADLGLRQRIADSPGGFVRTDGVHVANNLDDLLDGSIENPISVNEFGAVLHDIEVNDVLPVWTGCNAQGDSLGPNLQCAGPGLASWWFSSSIAYAEIGRPDRSDAGWLDTGVDSCSHDRHLYCVEQ